MAERLAIEKGIPAFAGDWLIGALKPAHRVLMTLERAEFIGMQYSLLEMLMVRQLMLRQPGIIDALVHDDVLSTWRDTAIMGSATLYVVEVICSDTRERMQSEFEPLTVNRLTLDALNPLEADVHHVVKDVIGSNS